MAARGLALSAVVLLLICQCAAAEGSWKCACSTKEEAKKCAEDAKAQLGGSDKKSVSATGTSLATCRRWFAEFKKTYNKKYDSPAAEAAAFKNFQKNLDKVHDVNLDDKRSWWADCNYFSDMDHDEVIKRYTSDPQVLKKGEERMKRRLLQEGIIPANDTSLVGEADKARRSLLASSVNWKAAGKVTATKWQDRCGGCWAYAAATAVESAYAISQGTKGKSTPIMSVQQFLDCANQNYGYFSMGCSGGTSDDAFLWGSRNHMVQESAYPNINADSGSCRLPSSGRVIKMAKSGGMVPQRSEAGLKKAVSAQPVVAYYAAGSDFINYAGGIFEATDCPSSANHGLTVYGYDAAGGYWLAQNSWGTWWGYDSGQVKLRMTGEGSDGPCLLYTFGAYPSKQFSQTLKSGRKMK